MWKNFDIFHFMVVSHTFEAGDDFIARWETWVSLVFLIEDKNSSSSDWFLTLPSSYNDFVDILTSKNINSSFVSSVTKVSDIKHACILNTFPTVTSNHKSQKFTVTFFRPTFFKQLLNRRFQVICFRDQCVPL